MIECHGSNRQSLKNVFFPPAPSTPPIGVNVSNTTSSSISVQWGPVVCIQRNGNIIGYLVRYRVEGTWSYQIMSVSGGDTTETTITGLDAGTTYSIEVAAVNNAGTGKYNLPISVTTQGTVFIKYHFSKYKLLQEKRIMTKIVQAVVIKGVHKLDK